MREHLAGAELVCARAPRLDPLRSRVRALLLAELGRYRRRGRFPRNHESRSRVPQFIDEHGTRCAVAHLMHVSGQGEIVRHIARSQNAARIHELGRLPELRAWLHAAGLTLEEAARIQPAYCYEAAARECFCNQSELAYAGLATIVSAEGTPNRVRVRVERIEGAALEWGVGDVIEIEGPLPARVGEVVLFGPAGESGGPAQLASSLSVQGDNVVCGHNGFTSNSPVRVDTVLEAVRLSPGSCVDVFAGDDSRWNRRYCDSPGLDEAEDGCSVAPHGAAPFHAGGLTSAALLAALLVHRRVRRPR